MEEERDEGGQVLRERYVLFSLLHRRLGGKERKGEKEKGQEKYFLLWQRK